MHCTQARRPHVQHKLARTHLHNRVFKTALSYTHTPSMGDTSSGSRPGCPGLQARVHTAQTLRGWYTTPESAHGRKGCPGVNKYTIHLRLNPKLYNSQKRTHKQNDMSMSTHRHPRIKFCAFQLLQSFQNKIFFHITQPSAHFKT